MKRTLRYLGVNYFSTLLACICTLSAISLVGSQLLQLSAFDSYYMMLPMMNALFVLIYGVNLVTLYRDLALSFNCRRKDYFRSCQLLFAAVALVCLLVTIVVGRLPQLLGFGYVDFPDAIPFADALRTGVPIYADPKTWLPLLLIYWLFQPLGGAMGCAHLVSKALGVFVMVIAMLLGVAGTVVILFLSDGTLSLSPRVLLLFLLVLAAVALVCQVILYRSCRRATVR